MNLPTKITISRIIMIALMLIALFAMSFVDFTSPNLFGPEGFRVNLVFLILLVFFLLASFTDWLDGHLARKNNQVTDLGKFLDPVADKLLINSLCIFLCSQEFFRYAPEQHITFKVWCVILLVARDIIVDALRFVASSKGVVIGANIFGKAKTVLEMVAISIVLLNGFPFSYFDASWPAGLRIADFFVYLATAASIISGIIYLAKYGYVLKEKKDHE